MKRVTRRSRADAKKGLRPIVIWGGGALGVLVFFVTLVLLERGARLDVPDLPEGEAGQFVFYSALKKDGPDTAAKMLPTEQVRDTDEGATEVVEKAPEPKPETTPKKKAEAEIRPAPAAPKTAEKPAARPAPPSGTVYSIQVAATKEQKAAQTMVGRLKGRGYDAYFVHEVVRDKGAWYRVRVGPYADRAAAMAAVERLSEKERLNGFLIVDRK